MKLIICEKPSLAKNVCAAIEKNGFKPKKGTDCTIIGDYVVVAAFGHLFELFTIEEYQPNYDPSVKTYWNFDSIPCFPDPYKFKLKTNNQTKETDSGVAKRFNVIKNLINDAKIDGIINCGDSDREGEIIVRIILKQAGNKKPVYRLWLPDQTETTILSALKNLEDDKKYDALAFEGFTRMFMDWNYGINLSRYATLKSGTLIRVGRVISAIVKAIYDRDMEIRNFIPTKYFMVVSNEETNGEKITLVSSRKFKNDELTNAQKVSDEYNKNIAKVIDKKTERKIIQSPKLFSQSNLQNELSKRFNYSPDETLNLVQTLYEKGLVSYPRTPTEYLATAEKDKVKSIISLINGSSKNLIFKDKKNIFDDSKIESHSAIIPTTKMATQNSFATDEERNCYVTIYNRFRSVFCKEDCLEDQTTLQISVGDLEVFKLKGNVPVQRGWKQFEGKADNEKLLPKLEIGDIVNIKFAPVEKETTPKSHFTVETLNNYLKNPFSDEVAAVNDDKEYAAMLNGLEIGTEATRPGIILTAIKSNYIQLNKKTYTICPAGGTFINTMERLQIDMTKEKTVFMGKQLKDVFKGTCGSRNVLSIVNKEILETIQKNIEIPRVYDNSGCAVIGKCPRCGNVIYDKPKLAVCSNDKCNFKIWKTVAKKTITNSDIKQLLTKGKTKLIKGFTSKKGTLFDAILVLSGDAVAFEFPEK